MFRTLEGSLSNYSGLPQFVIAFQPIVDVNGERIIAYEALTRGLDGKPYPDLVAGFDLASVRKFQRETAKRAMQRAVSLGIEGLGVPVCLNLEPDLDPEAVDADFILKTAAECGLAPSSILLELTEDHRLSLPNLRTLLARNRAAGFCTCMDDFGAGYAGLTMLAECRPEILKLDRGLIRSIDSSDTRQKIVAAFQQICNSLDMSLIAEGVETHAECAMLRQLGIHLMQGYLFSRPVADQLPTEITWSAAPVARSGRNGGSGRDAEAGWGIRRPSFDLGRLPALRA